MFLQKNGRFKIKSLHNHNTLYNISVSISTIKSESITYQLLFSPKRPILNTIYSYTTNYARLQKKVNYIKFTTSSPKGQLWLKQNIRCTQKLYAKESQTTCSLRTTGLKQMGFNRIYNQVIAGKCFISHSTFAACSLIRASCCSSFYFWVSIPSLAAWISAFWASTISVTWLVNESYSLEVTSLKCDFGFGPHPWPTI